MSVPTAHDSIARWVKDAGGKPETSIPVNVVMLAQLVMEYEQARPAVDDLADSAAEPLRMADVDAEELSAIVDDLKMLYREAQEEGLA